MLTLRAGKGKKRAEIPVSLSTKIKRGQVNEQLFYL